MARKQVKSVAGKVVAMVSKADRIADANLRLQMLRHLDEVLDGALHVAKQARCCDGDVGHGLLDAFC